MGGGQRIGFAVADERMRTCPFDPLCESVSSNSLSASAIPQAIHCPPIRSSATPEAIPLAYTCRDPADRSSVLDPLIRYGEANPLSTHPFIRYGEGNPLTTHPLKRCARDCVIRTVTKEGAHDVAPPLAADRPLPTVCRLHGIT